MSEGLFRTGRLPGELRSTAKFNVVPERQIVVPKQTTVEYTFSGPCLRCGTDIQYKGFARWSKKNVEDWLLEQFSEKRRKAHISYIEGRRGTCLTMRVEDIICEQCRACHEHAQRDRREKAERDKAERKRKEEREEQERLKERERYVYHVTWHKRTRADAARLPDGSARYVVTWPGGITQLLFRWRPTAGDWRGDSPLNIVGVWQDGVLIAHYYGWNLVPLAGERPYFGSDVEYSRDNYQIWPPREDVRQEDVFGVGFCRFLQRACQQELLRAKPDMTWSAAAVGDAVDGTEKLSHLTRPSIVHTRWVDGSVFAAVVPSSNLETVKSFAKKLGVQIRKAK